MSYTREEIQRHRQFFERSSAREKMLIEQAEQLIAQRAKEVGVSPAKLINQIFEHVPDPPKTKRQVDDDDISAKLIARLARSDRTGAGSGRDVGE